MKKKTKKFYWITLFIVVIFVKLGFAQKLKLLFFHRPPYYIYDKNGVRGIILKRAIYVLKQAKVEFELELSTPNRIMESFKRGHQNICSPGWFKTKERTRWAKFSVPIYQNKPIVLLTGKWNQRLIKFHSLSQIFRLRSYTWGRIKNFSYGEVIDRYQQQFKPRTINIDGDQLNLIHMLKYKRFSYMLISPEEIDFLIASAGYDKKNFVIIHLKDVKKGNKRYLMFSKDVSDRLIKKINEFILKIQ